MGYAEIRERNDDGTFSVPTVHSGFDKKKYLKEYHQKNKAKKIAAAVEWGRKNKARRKIIKEKWRAANREKTNFLSRMYSYRKKNAQGTADFAEVVAMYGKPCHYCKEKPADTIDHVVPLSRGGTNDLSNLVPACVSCNSKKGNKLI